MVLATSPAGRHAPWFAIDRTGQAVAGSGASAASTTWWMTTGRLWDDARDSLDVVCRPTGTALPAVTMRTGGVAREPLPNPVDRLDVQLAPWIGQSTVTSQ